MPRNTTVAAPAATWTQLTDANVTSITFQNVCDFNVWIKGTTNTTAPTDLTGALRYPPGQGELNREMADLFPGLAAQRVWIYGDTGVSVMVSHA